MYLEEKAVTDTPLEVLFVDDEKNVLQSLRRLFMDENYTVLVAHSGEEALEILRQNPNIGLIVSDQRMPGLSGVDFLEKAMHMAPHALRILLTGYADIDAVADAINRGGACRYITKPWKDDEMLQVIRDAVRQSSLIRENNELQSIVAAQNEELRQWNAQLEDEVKKQTLEIQKKNEELERLNDHLRKNFKNTIIAFSVLLELHDRRTVNHSRRVAEFSGKIAQEMNLSAKDTENIVAAALLHDIGKLGIPEAALAKDVTAMTPSELIEYKRHSVRGQAAIDSVEELRDAGILIRHHHEAYNGTGFPGSLAAEEIPLGSRIIALADCMDRAFNASGAVSPLETALQKTLGKKGEILDPALFEHIEKPIREVYAGLRPEAGDIEIEVPPDVLKEGMVLARDVKSGTGLVFLSRGRRLTQKTIQSIQRYYELDPSETGIVILSGTRR